MIWVLAVLVVSVSRDVDVGPGYGSTGCGRLGRHADLSEREVANEEDARPDAVDGVAEAQVSLHLELRESHVDPVEVRKDVAEDEKRRSLKVTLS